MDPELCEQPNEVACHASGQASRAKPVAQVEIPAYEPGWQLSHRYIGVAEHAPIGLDAGAELSDHHRSGHGETSSEQEADEKAWSCVLGRNASHGEDTCTDGVTNGEHYQVKEGELPMLLLLIRSLQCLVRSVEGCVVLRGVVRLLHRLHADHPIGHLVHHGLVVHFGAVQPARLVVVHFCE